MQDQTGYGKELVNTALLNAHIKRNEKEDLLIVSFVKKLYGENRDNLNFQKVKLTFVLKSV